MGGHHRLMSDLTAEQEAHMYSLVLAKSEEESNPVKGLLSPPDVLPEGVLTILEALPPEGFTEAFMTKALKRKLYDAVYETVLQHVIDSRRATVPKLAETKEISHQNKCNNRITGRR